MVRSLSEGFSGRIGRRALYHLLKNHRIRGWEEGALQPWQIEDYRSVSTENLFERLQNLHISVDYSHFKMYAEAAETPEEFTDILLADKNPSMELYDQVYLVLFELWRRLLPEKVSLSIFCDRMDHWIDQYDQDTLESTKEVADVLDELAKLIEEQMDMGVAAEEAFHWVEEECANDIEGFLYDFLAEQIELDNRDNARDYLETFFPCLSNSPWFCLLKADLLVEENRKGAMAIVTEVIKECKKLQDIDLAYEILHLLAQVGEKWLFASTLNLICQWIQTEEDFQELLEISSEYLRLGDADEASQKIDALLAERIAAGRSSGEFNAQHPDFKKFISIIQPLFAEKR